MATCNCGGKKITVKKVSPKKVAPKKVAVKKVDPKTASKRSQRLSAQATKKATRIANKRAKGCNCTN